jgi:hypothetical protein
MLTKSTEKKIQTYAKKHAGLYKWLGRNASGYDNAGLASDVIAHFELSSGTSNTVVEIVRTVINDLVAASAPVSTHRHILNEYGYCSYCGKE